jgi:hypothetical protein
MGLRNVYDAARKPLRIAAGVLLIIWGIIDIPLPGPGLLFVAMGIMLIGPRTRPGRWIRRNMRMARRWYASRFGKKKA